MGAAPRRLLLVSYLYVPSVLIGAQRWLHMSRAALERGWTIDVLMMDPSSEQAVNMSLLEELPPGVRLFGIKQRNSALRRLFLALARKTSRFRGWVRAAPPGSATQGSESSRENERSAGTFRSRLLELPRAMNAWLFFSTCNDWIKRATAVGHTLHQQEPYDLILSSGPPHMAHVAARNIGKATSVPFIVDMRDAIALPEVEPPDARSWVWREFSNTWESGCVDDATRIIANTEELQAALQDRYPSAKDRLFTIMNGADPDLRILSKRSETFVIAHTGSIYVGRDPRSLFLALGRFVERRGLNPAEIRLHLMGETTFEGVLLEKLAEEAGVAPYVVVEPTRPRAAALELLARAAVLVILPQSVPYAIPAKVFEYAQAPAWLLVLAEPGSSLQRLLQNSAASVLAPSNVEAISQVLEVRFDAFRRGERPLPLNIDGRFDRIHQTRKLMDVLDQLIPPARPSPAPPDMATK